jgi:cob(I)alamin adenosyltransferase
LGILETDIELLENEIDSMENELPEMTHSYLEATLPCHIVILHDAYAAAERLAHLSHNEPVAEIAIKYLNRLSDYLFVLARKLSQDLSAEEVKWIPRNNNPY